MGTYTPVLKLYKPAATEFVDPEVQLNANWDIADDAMKKLLEYKYVTDAVPDVANTFSRSRFYKAYSNSFMAWFSGSNFFWQDPNAFVSTWVSAKSLLQAGWIEHASHPLCYRIVKRSGGSVTEIEWTGAFTNNDSVTIDKDVNTFFIDIGGLPTSIRPAVNKYFNVNAGNTSTNYSMARVLIGADGRAEFKRYGADPANPGTENRIELTGIKYSLEVTGT